MPASDRMHYQVALCDLSHNFYGLGQCAVVHSKMLHGIQMEAHSNAAVIHDGDHVSD